MRLKTFNFVYKSRLWMCPVSDDPVIRSMQCIKFSPSKLITSIYKGSCTSSTARTGRQWHVY